MAYVCTFLNSILPKVPPRNLKIRWWTGHEPDARLASGS